MGNLSNKAKVTLPEFQNGVNIREVQSLLGHKNVETTMIYTHVQRDMTCAPQSPLDALYAKRVRTMPKLSLTSIIL